MKRFYLKWGQVLVDFAMIVVNNSVNVACSYNYHQDEIPEKAKSLRKF
ncbi:MAG: cyclic lactone autoinducer peptide [Lachnospiraceae bacterium]